MTRPSNFPFLDIFSLTFYVPRIFFPTVIWPCPHQTPCSSNPIQKENFDIKNHFKKGNFDGKCQSKKEILMTHVKICCLHNPSKFPFLVILIQKGTLNWKSFQKKEFLMGQPILKRNFFTEKIIPKKEFFMGKIYSQKGKLV